VDEEERVAKERWMECKSRGMKLTAAAWIVPVFEGTAARGLGAGLFGVWHGLTSLEIMPCCSHATHPDSAAHAPAHGTSTRLDFVSTMVMGNSTICPFRREHANLLSSTLSPQHRTCSRHTAPHTSMPCIRPGMALSLCVHHSNRLQSAAGLARVDFRP
jgi:hypothetical protein